MEGLVLAVLLPLLLLLPASDAMYASDGDSPVRCSTAGVECEYNQTTLIDQVLQVDTLALCRQLCLDNGDCHFISYYDDNAFPFTNLCQLFKTCESVTPCSDCVSENMQCYETCGYNFVGQLGENILVLSPHIESELACKKLCLENSNCSWYTYFYASDSQFHEDCVLLAELLPPLQDCDHCVTGVPDCISQQCGLEMNGELSQSLMVTDTSESQSITVFGVASCELRILAVGGGGGCGGHNRGGAGSGYLQYRTISVNPGTIVTLDVGDQQEPSTVAIGNGDTVTAQRGQDSQRGDGGDGYSGGGGYGSHGGSDGGDGDDGSYVGGSGTGEDISLYVFDAWTLSPGAGGDPGSVDNTDYSGGGGGCVLVDGAGPEANVYQGQGYGGGCGGGGYDGLQGIILIETTSVGRRR